MKSIQKIDNLNSIEIYEKVLNREISRFPKYFWRDMSGAELKLLLKYFFEEKLKWDLCDIKCNLNSYIFYKYKLGGGMFQNIFNGSPFKVVNFVYPNQIKEWELKCTPLSYWTKDTYIEAFKYILNKEKWTKDTYIEAFKYILNKEKWTKNDIKTKSIINILDKYKMLGVHSRVFKGNTYDLIDTIYPNEFQPWEVCYTPKDYWNIETGKKAVKWMIEDKLKWTDKDIKEKYCLEIFKQYKLTSMLSLVFQWSPFKAINTTYPNRFTEEDFNNVPINYWTKEKAIKSMKKLLDNLDEESIKRCVSIRFFVENGLGYPFQKYFQSQIFLVLSTIYPNKFK